MRGGQEFVDEFLPEDVEDNLQAGEAGLLEAQKAFLNGLDAHAPVLDETFALQGAQVVKDFAATEFVGGDAVELGEE